MDGDQNIMEFQLDLIQPYEYHDCFLCLKSQ